MSFCISTIPKSHVYSCLCVRIGADFAQPVSHEDILAAMSRSLTANNELVLPAAPYVDATLTVTCDEVEMVDGAAMATAPTLPLLQAHFPVHRLVLSSLSMFFRTKFQQLEEEDKNNNSLDDDFVPWTLTIHLPASDRRLYDLFPSFLGFLNGKPLQKPLVRSLFPVKAVSFCFWCFPLWSSFLVDFSDEIR